MYDNNVIVVGAGSAGLIAALIASTLKAKVALVESNLMGGDCLNTGCVPSKTLIASAKRAQAVRQSADFGIHTHLVEVDFRRVMQRIREAVGQIEPNDSVERYTNLGVECVNGHANLIDPHTIEVNGRELTGRSIILAIGAEPLIPPIPGLKEAGPLTTENLWELDDLPKRLTILGGGPVGCELAQAFSRLGSDVTIIERFDRLLPSEDVEVSELIQSTFETEGISVFTGFTATSCSQSELTVRSSDSEENIGFDRVLVAAGREPRGDRMGLDNIGVRRNENGTIAVNPFLQTNVPSIYSCGDVVGPHQFTHLAAQQAWYAATNALLRPFWRFKFDDSIAAWAIFTDPEVASVGRSEQELKDAGISLDTTKFEFKDLDRAIAEGHTEGFVKLFTVKNSDRLLGACIVGENAGELISTCISAMSHGYGLNRVLNTLHVYPTRMEAIRLAAGEHRRTHASRVLLKLAKRINSMRR